MLALAVYIPFVPFIVWFGAIVNWLVVAGMFLNQVFSLAVANVQYDSYTGIFMMLGIVFVYAGMCLTLVHNCFNLVFIIPDQVIAWIGGHASTAMGRDADARSKAAFMAAVGRSEGSARDMRQMFRDKPKGDKSNKANGVKE